MTGHLRRFRVQRIALYFMPGSLECDSTIDFILPNAPPQRCLRSAIQKRLYSVGNRNSGLVTNAIQKPDIDFI